MKRDATRLMAETYHREFRFDVKEADTESRSVPASLSSETEVERWFGKEVLSHEATSVDLGRADGNGLPMLFNHDPMQPIGVVRDVRVDGKRIKGTLVFSSNARAEEIWNDVQQGFLERMSIGYRINEWVERDDSDIVTATRWTLFEASIVTVPADNSVGVNRKYSPEGLRMTDAIVESAELNQPPQGGAPANIVQLRQAKATGVEEGMKRERDRVASIDQLFIPERFAGDEFRALREQAVVEGWDVNRTRDEMLLLVGTGVLPVASAPVSQRSEAYTGGDRGTRREARVVAGDSDLDGFHRGALMSLMARCGTATKEERDESRKSEFTGLSLLDLAREFLRRANVSTRGMDKMSVVGTALTYRTSPSIGYTTSDFTNLLINSANKAMMAGYQEAPETWQAWARATNVSDFKRFDRLNLSTFGDLDVVPEGGQYKYGTLSDLREYGQLKTYGKLFSISRQAIINDDLNSFTGIPQKMGTAAARMVGDEAYGILSGNPTLNQDSVALFHSSRANLITSGAAPSVTTLNAGYAWMATRTDPGGSTLNVRPRHLLVPIALENTARVLLAAQYDPAGTAGTLTPNPWNGRLSVVSDPRLDAFNAAGWFILADGVQHPTVEVVFLDGNQAPYLEEQSTFSVDGAAYKVRLDVVALAVDWRGAYYNDGA